jgi:hypothetical protein
MTRLPIALIVLLFGVLTLPAHAVGGDDPLPPQDELGMFPRPTLECGGKDAIQQWEVERTLRRNDRARARIWPALHRIFGPLSAALDPFGGALHLVRLEAFDACISAARPLDLGCVAAARRDPALCGLKDHPEFYRPCLAGVVALQAALEGDHLGCAALEEPALRRVCERRVLGDPDRSIGCAADDRVCQLLTLLSVDVCRRGWYLARQWPQTEEICRWVVLTDLLRVDPERACDTVPGEVQRLCWAVRDREARDCPDAYPERGAAVLARPCRNPQVLVPEVPTDQVAYGKGVIVTVPLLNPFATVAACRVTVRLSDGARTRFVATSDPVMLPGGFKDAAREFLVSKRFRMAPADPGLEVSVSVDCAWAPAERPTFRGDGAAIVD